MNINWGVNCPSFFTVALYHTHIYNNSDHRVKGLIKVYLCGIEVVTQYKRKKTMINELKILLKKSKRYGKELEAIKKKQKKFDSLWELYTSTQDVKYLRELKALYDC